MSYWGRTNCQTCWSNSHILHYLHFLIQKERLLCLRSFQEVLSCLRRVLYLPLLSELGDNNTSFLLLQQCLSDNCRLQQLGKWECFYWQNWCYLRSYGPPCSCIAYKHRLKKGPDTPHQWISCRIYCHHSSGTQLYHSRHQWEFWTRDQFSHIGS